MDNGDDEYSDVRGSSRREEPYFDPLKPPYNPGDVIARQFEVVRILGMGGMGVVYEVIDRLTRQHLALKQFRHDLARKKTVRDCFLQEVAVARQLRHPNIVAVFDVRQEGELLFYTMELLEGKSLRECLKQRGLLSLEEAAVIIFQLCEALEHAHQFTVHRDVSPENIMVTPSGVKLLDFGIAKVLNSEADVKGAVGKTYYTAPEQIEDSRMVDARADIYSMGVLLMEMLTGRVPRKPLASDFAYAGLPPAVCSVIAGAVAPLEERFVSVRVFQQNLQRCLESLGVLEKARPSAKPSEGEKKTPKPQVSSHRLPEKQSPPPKPRGRRKGSGILLPLIVVGAVIFGVVMLERLETPTSPPPQPPEAPRTPVSSGGTARVPSVAEGTSRWRVSERNAVLTLPQQTTMEFARIRMGTFRMGSGEGRISDASPEHEVTISRAFWMQKTEVTQAQWHAVMQTRPWASQPNVLEHPDAPAVYISWYDAQEFLAQLNALGAGNFRLPTEAEWEYACRAGASTVYSFGDNHDDLLNVAWFQKNTRQLRIPSAQITGVKEPNPWSLFDIHGNVAEWCWDWYKTGYDPEARSQDPVGPVSGTFKVVRGGSWRDFERNCTCVVRGKEHPGSRSSTIGFRVCRDF